MQYIARELWLYLCKCRQSALLHFYNHQEFPCCLTAPEPLIWLELCLSSLKASVTKRIFWKIWRNSSRKETALGGRKDWWDSVVRMLRSERTLLGEERNMIMQHQNCSSLCRTENNRINTRPNFPFKVTDGRLPYIGMQIFLYFIFHRWIINCSEFKKAFKGGGINPTFHFVYWKKMPCLCVANVIFLLITMPN